MAKQESIGALWIEEGRDHVEYFKGSITIGGVAHRITVFRNGYRTEGSRQPHYRIYASIGSPAERPHAPPEPRDLDTRTHADPVDVDPHAGGVSAEDIPF